VYEVRQQEVEDMGDGTGEYLWPRQQRGDGKWFGFNAKVLALKRAKYLDRTQFHAQYYNNPNDPESEAIGSDNFQHYEREFLKKIEGEWCYNGKPLAIFAAIDFAFSLRRVADYTVVIVVGVSSTGDIYVLDIKRKRTNKTAEYYKLVYDTHMKWGYRKLRAEVTVAQEVIAERIKDDIKKDGLVLSVDKFRPTRTMGTKEERIHNALSPRYENQSIWHYAGGLCEELESELVQHNPAFDDIKDALHSVVGIIRVPLDRSLRRRRNNVITHARFGGVAA
jgi:predicted phage terminase large subunit-like protein